MKLFQDAEIASFTFQQQYQNSLKNYTDWENTIEYAVNYAVKQRLKEKYEEIKL